MCVAKVMNVSVRTASTGDVKVLAKKNGADKDLCEYEQQFLVHLALSKPGIYLREMQEELYSHTVRWADESTICRTLHHIGMSYQNIKHFCMSRCESKRAEFRVSMSCLMIIWVDETGSEIQNSHRKYGYGIRGIPPRDDHIRLRGKHYSAIGILSTKGIEDVYITDTFGLCQVVFASSFDAI